MQTVCTPVASPPRSLRMSFNLDFITADARASFPSPVTEIRRRHHHREGVLQNLPHRLCHPQFSAKRPTRASKRIADTRIRQAFKSHGGPTCRHAFLFSQLSDAQRTPMDLLKDRYICRPKQQVYENDVLSLTEKVDGYVRSRLPKTNLSLLLLLFFVFFWFFCFFSFPHGST